MKREFKIHESEMNYDFVKIEETAQDNKPIGKLQVKAVKVESPKEYQSEVSEPWSPLLLIAFVFCPLIILGALIVGSMMADSERSEKAKKTKSNTEYKYKTESEWKREYTR
jgi:hypothetical protein